MHVNSECGSVSNLKWACFWWLDEFCSREVLERKARQKGYYLMINNAEHFPSSNLTTDSWKSSPDNSCRKGSCAALFFIIHRAMLVGILYLLCGNIISIPEKRLCLRESKSGLFRVSRLCSQKMLWEVFLFLFCLLAKLIQQIYSTNHRLQTHIYACYILLLCSNLLRFFIMSGAVRSD